MNIIISGYGKMGKEIEKEALKKDHTIIAVFDQPDDWRNLEKFTPLQPVVIDFSEPDQVVANIRKCFEFNIPVVVGTTGWDDQKNSIRDLCIASGQSLFTASNFSIGMNLFFMLNRYFAGLMNAYEDYDVLLEEIHHIHKKDKPSGTAITLANILTEAIEKKSDWSLVDKISSETIKINVVREGDVTGTHSITYDSPIDSIKLTHKAKNRRGFALGAILAAEWIQYKKGFYGMEDMLTK
ncbi:MAG: 4-hydroxy-tetrahydrodipicolinate reductase [Bacteroidales bacterium]|nr:4-hydroxy-tetrahydrodipicolinate reductase [Bacteroidales bacterium]